MPPDTPRTLPNPEHRRASRCVWGLVPKAPSLQPIRPSAGPHVHATTLRAVLGLRPRKGSRVAGLQAVTRSCLQTHNTFAAALTDAP